MLGELSNKQPSTSMLKKIIAKVSKNFKKCALNIGTCFEIRVWEIVISVNKSMHSYFYDEEVFLIT